MLGLWIVLFAVYSKACSAEKTFTVELMHGNQLTIKLSSMYDTVKYTTTDESKTTTLYSSNRTPKRGYVVKVNKSWELIIQDVTFEDQGTYKVENFWNILTSVYLLKVITKTATYKCVAGETLSIPLAGLPKNNVSLSFSTEDFNLTLVKRGSAVGNTHPDYLGRIEVTSQSIKVLNVNVSDVGNYTLTDHLNRTVSISSMILIAFRERASLYLALLGLLALLVCICCCCCCCCCCCTKRKSNFMARGTTGRLDVVKPKITVTPPKLPTIDGSDIKHEFTFGAHN